MRPEPDEFEFEMHDATFRAHMEFEDESVDGPPEWRPVVIRMEIRPMGADDFVRVDPDYYPDQVERARILADERLI